MTDLSRIVRSVHNRINVAADRARGRLLRLSRGPTLKGGDGLMAGRGVELQLYGELQLGRNVRLSSGCLLSVGPGARLQIGDDCFIGRGTVIVANQSVSIEDHVDVAEHCSIRDSDHHLTAAERAKGASVQSPIVIGRGTWIAAGVRVLRGSHLGPGVVVAANAVVRESFGARALVAGVPARVIRILED